MLFCDNSYIAAPTSRLLHRGSYIAVMRTTIDEAQRLGAGRYGSQHALLGLLGTDDPVTRRVVLEYPLLTRLSAAPP